MTSRHAARRQDAPKPRSAGRHVTRVALTGRRRAGMERMRREGGVVTTSTRVLVCWLGRGPEWWKVRGASADGCKVQGN